jgi:hypothetical protein
MKVQHGRLALTVALVVVALLGILGPVDRISAVQLADTTQRALVAFAAARGLNAAISAVQGTEVALQPAGVGVTLTPGQLLDPVNDLVERLSWVMLASAVSLGVQQLVLSVSASSSMAGLLVGAALVLGCCVWRPAWRRHLITQVLLRLALLTLVLRFAMPLYVVGANGFYEGFLADEYTSATAQIEQTRERIESAQAGNPANPDAGDGSWWDKIAGSVENMRGAAGLDGRIKHYTSMVGDLADNVIKLTVVFVTQSMLMPLVFLWLLVATARAVLRVPRSTSWS